ncbi:MAG TPA: DUF6659 family protein [Candidatus Bathyarchaeia archaeon]|nr:DUF6659 family protein [Candidatus Bathyarchaeia archaeon]
MTSEALVRRPQLELICKQISHIDDHVDLVAILNHKGRVEDMIARDDGINRDLTAHKREMLFMESVLHASMYSEYDDEFGRVKVSVIQREKVLVFSFQIDNYYLLVISKPVLNPAALQQKIASVIFNYTTIAN